MLQEVVKRMSNCFYQYHKKGNKAQFIFSATVGDMCGKEGAGEGATIIVWRAAFGHYKIHGQTERRCEGNSGEA